MNSINLRGECALSSSGGYLRRLVPTHRHPAARLLRLVGYLRWNGRPRLGCRRAEVLLVPVAVVARVCTAVGPRRVLAVPVHDHAADGVVKGGLRADVQAGEALIRGLVRVRVRIRFRPG